MIHAYYLAFRQGSQGKVHGVLPTTPFLTSTNCEVDCTEGEKKTVVKKIY